MLSLNDIINASFRKAGFSGYKTDDVDAFLDQVRDSYDQLQKKAVEQDEEIEKLRAENRQMTEKVKILADKVEEFRSQEDEIKNALISAQKVGDASVREARHRAEVILKDANLKAERIAEEAEGRTAGQKRELERLQRAVSDFRSQLLAAYKEHLTLIDALPVSKPEAPQEPPREEPAPVRQEEMHEAAPQTEAPREDGDDAFRADISCFDGDEPAER